MTEVRCTSCLLIRIERIGACRKMVLSKSTAMYQWLTCRTEFVLLRRASLAAAARSVCVCLFE